MKNKINIRPGVSILSVLKHLNYKPWFALAEFVDNSIQSYLDYEKKLKKIDGKKFNLIVKIEIDPNRKCIIIRDNAAGIFEKEYERAFRAAELPPDTSGLCEFGMGMKSAACWFSAKWTVISKALEEKLEKTITFDIDKIVEDKLEELIIKTKTVKTNNHYTVIKLTKLHNFPHGRTLTKIKAHLQSIYRDFIKRGKLILYFGNEKLSVVEPKILKTPYYKDENGKSLLWKKNLDFDFGKGLCVKGFAALRETASTSEAGFALFRRGRVIEGSADEGFRPEIIFRRSNSFTYQRLFGELFLDGFKISHTKDGFKWDDNMEAFLDLLKEELEKKPLQILSQAEGYRKNPKKADLKIAAKKTLNETAEIMEVEMPSFIEELRETQKHEIVSETLSKTKDSLHKNIDIEMNNSIWSIDLELSYDQSIEDWIEIGDHLINPIRKLNKSKRHVGIRVSLVHNFMSRFINIIDEEMLMPIVRLAAAIGLAEVIARESGVRNAIEIRRNINEILIPLSKP